MKFGRAGKGPVPPKGTQGPGSLERLKALEQFRDEILRAVRKTFNEVEQRMRSAEEVNEALVNLAGREAVEEEVKRLYIERAEAKSVLEGRALEAGIKAGKLVVSEIVGDMSVVVGSEVDKDGNQLYPSRAQLLFATLRPEYQEKLRGSKVGDVIVTPFESKFTVLAIYDILPQAPPPAGQQVSSEPLPVGTPPVEGQPLSDEAEAAVLDQLSNAAEQIASQAAAVEDQLVEDLAQEAEKSPA
jgi:hypothetical protein